MIYRMAREAAYKNFEATALFCPHCKKATPVRKRLLLVLLDGEKYEYLCTRCGRTVGDKVEKGGEKAQLIIH
jgi:transposase-like protein